MLPFLVPFTQNGAAFSTERLSWRNWLEN